MTDDNIFLKVRRAFPEGSPCKPGTDRAWICEVWGKTEEANPFSEGLAPIGKPVELEMPPDTAPELPPEPEQTDTLEYRMRHPSKGSHMPKVRKTIVADDLGEKPPMDW